MVALKATPSISQAKAIREKASESDFTEDYLVCILSEKKPNQREPMIVEEEEIKQYFPSHYNSEQMHNTILLLIRNWSKKRGCTIILKQQTIESTALPFWQGYATF